MFSALMPFGSFFSSNAATAGLLAGIGFLASSVSMAADTGDAPASYGQASHAVVAGSPWLGDEEPDDNQPTADDAAQGDDIDGLDDEDGVFAFPILVQNGKSYDTNVFATNPTLTDVVLAGWIDFDGNGRFDVDEFATAIVPVGTVNQKFKLEWPNLLGVTSSFSGATFARFRISSATMQASDAQGPASDGEVEDYLLEVLLDTDGDERPDITDLDNDNDGIPDIVEGTTLDTDNDLTPDYLDVDSDGDFIPDFIEAGGNPLNPLDTDSDGVPDYLDLDSNNDGVPDNQAPTGDADRDGISDDLEGIGDNDTDGIPNSRDLDSDNDTIPDSIELGSDPELPADTDGDGVADFLDLDSDNDGIPDIREANSGELNVSVFDVDRNGQVDAQAITGENGLIDAVETSPDSGIPLFAVADVDQDGQRDFRDLDSDGDGVFDVLETQGLDIDSNGIVDSVLDVNSDGLIDGTNAIDNNGELTDVDDDGIPDFQDDDTDGSQSLAPNLNASNVVETGLSGAGCSVAAYGTESASQRGDWLFLVLTLLSVVTLILRRQQHL